uniref:Uncharacterized protein n=1 Tax=Candidozyma auris TaxID=498019 RepID=A0A0L0NX16_CANAR
MRRVKNIIFGEGQPSPPRQRNSGLQPPIIHKNSGKQGHFMKLVSALLPQAFENAESAESAEPAEPARPAEPAEPAETADLLSDPEEDDKPPQETATTIVSSTPLKQPAKPKRRYKRYEVTSRRRVINPSLELEESEQEIVMSSHVEELSEDSEYLREKQREILEELERQLQEMGGWGENAEESEKGDEEVNEDEGKEGKGEEENDKEEEKKDKEEEKMDKEEEKMDKEEENHESRVQDTSVPLWPTGNEEITGIDEEFIDVKKEKLTEGEPVNVSPRVVQLNMGKQEEAAENKSTILPSKKYPMRTVKESQASGDIKVVAFNRTKRNCSKSNNTRVDACLSVDESDDGKSLEYLDDESEYYSDDALTSKGGKSKKPFVEHNLPEQALHKRPRVILPAKYKLPPSVQLSTRYPRAPALAPGDVVPSSSTTALEPPSSTTLPPTSRTSMITESAHADEIKPMKTVQAQMKGKSRSFSLSNIAYPNLSPSRSANYKRSPNSLPLPLLAQAFTKEQETSYRLSSQTSPVNSHEERLPESGKGPLTTIIKKETTKQDALIKSETRADTSIKKEKADGTVKPHAISQEFNIAALDWNQSLLSSSTVQQPRAKRIKLVPMSVSPPVKPKQKSLAQQLQERREQLAMAAKKAQKL